MHRVVRVFIFLFIPKFFFFLILFLFYNIPWELSTTLILFVFSLCGRQKMSPTFISGFKWPSLLGIVANTHMQRFYFSCIIYLVVLWLKLVKKELDNKPWYCTCRFNKHAGSLFDWCTVHLILLINKMCWLLQFHPVDIF